jgi:hypothetical protein
MSDDTQSEDEFTKKAERIISTARSAQLHVRLTLERELKEEEFKARWTERRGNSQRPWPRSTLDCAPSTTHAFPSTGAMLFGY